VGTEILNLIDGEAILAKDIKCGTSSGSGTNQDNGEYSDFSTIISVSNLNQRSLPLNARHYGREDAAVVKAPANSYNVEYDFHNLNSFAAGEAAYDSLKKLDARHPLVMSTSSFFGMGRYTGHIVEDSSSNFNSLMTSMLAIFNFQLFGMPFTGVDICGQVENATAELCARWMALGSMYPFARNHNSQTSTPQEPYAFT